MNSFGAFAIIFDDAGRVLFARRRDYDLWNLPGGGSEEGEAPEETAVREVREEVGLEVEIDRLVSRDFHRKEHKPVYTFLCRIIRGVPVETDESREVRYFTYTEIPPNAAISHVWRVHKVLSNISVAEPPPRSFPSAIELLQQGEAVNWHLYLD